MSDDDSDKENLSPNCPALFLAQQPDLISGQVTENTLENTEELTLLELQEDLNKALRERYKMRLENREPLRTIQTLTVGMAAQVPEQPPAQPLPQMPVVLGHEAALHAPSLSLSARRGYFTTLERQEPHSPFDVAQMTMDDVTLTYFRNGVWLTAQGIAHACFHFEHGDPRVYEMAARMMSGSDAYTDEDAEGDDDMDEDEQPDRDERLGLQRASGSTASGQRSGLPDSSSAPSAPAVNPAALQQRAPLPSSSLTLTSPPPRILSTFVVPATDLPADRLPDGCIPWSYLIENDDGEQIPPCIPATIENLSGPSPPIPPLTIQEWVRSQNVELHDDSERLPAFEAALAFRDTVFDCFSPDEQFTLRVALRFLTRTGDSPSPIPVCLKVDGFVEGIYYAKGRNYSPLVCVVLPRMNELFARASRTWPATFGIFPSDYERAIAGRPYPHNPIPVVIYPDPGPIVPAAEPSQQQEGPAPPIQPSELAEDWIPPASMHSNTPSTISYGDSSPAWTPMEALTDWETLDRNAPARIELTIITGPSPDDVLDPDALASSTLVNPATSPRAEAVSISVYPASPGAAPTNYRQAFIREFSQGETETTDISSSAPSSDTDFLQEALLRPLPDLELPVQNLQVRDPTTPPSSEVTTPPATTPIVSTPPMGTTTTDKRAISPFVATVVITDMTGSAPAVDVQQELATMPPVEAPRHTTSISETPIDLLERPATPVPDLGVSNSLSQHLRPIFSLFTARAPLPTRMPVHQEVEDSAAHDDTESASGNSNSDGMPGLESVSGSDSSPSPLTSLSPSPDLIQEKSSAMDVVKTSEDTFPEDMPYHLHLQHGIEYFIPGYVRPPPSDRHDESQWIFTDVSTDYHPICMRMTVTQRKMAERCARTLMALDRKVADVSKVTFGSRRSPRNNRRLRDILSESELVWNFSEYTTFEELEEDLIRYSERDTPNRWQPHIIQLRQLRRNVGHLLHLANDLVKVFGYTDGLRSYADYHHINIWQEPLDSHALFFRFETQFLLTFRKFLYDYNLPQEHQAVNRILDYTFDCDDDLYLINTRVIKRMAFPATSFALSRLPTPA
ncbi:hypothetical protein CVT26_014327 [Gymnopilus dilepis]|uniref:Uncharacterized protein n=1 Tax=Gymnopilus dilepis TaxID=231916 RepID=A0A409WTQ9_9AGAR|nr:hypothetical protein CVT26_014327 [Gymnopilus dilepis]